eukprot:gene6517-7261_t
MSTKRRPYQLNIALIGDAGVGKTSLASVFAEGITSFPQTYITTNEKEIFSKQMKVGQIDVNLKIWDLSGHVNFRTVTTYHYQKADFLGEDEFNSLPKSLVGMKIDQRNKTVDDQKGLEKVESIPNTEFCVTSAKLNVGVFEAFENLVTRILAKKDIQISNNQAREGSPSSPTPGKTFLCNF